MKVTCGVGGDEAATTSDVDFRTERSTDVA